jgi:hypothetical protein
MQIATRQQFSRITLDPEDVPIALLSLAFEDDRFDVQLAQHISGCTTDVRFFRAAGQRALASNGQTSGCRYGTSGKQSRRKDQFVVRTKGITRWRNFFEE